MPVSNNPIQDVPVMPVVENVDSIQEQVIQTPKLTQDSQSADSVLGLSAAEMNVLIALGLPYLTLKLRW